MTLVERYLFRQLLTPIGWAILALTAVALLSQSLSTLDVIVERGQSPWVLAKVTFLALPRLMSMILPIAAFVGALIALNRMQTDNELVVCSAGGLSRWRMFAPAMKIAAALATLTLFLNLWVQPITYRAMHRELYEARTEAAAIFVKEGQFVQAGDNLTVYVQRIDQNGLLKNLFIHIQEKRGATTYTAQEGRIVSADGVPSLIMRKGSSQEFSRAGVLNYLSFDDYVFDLSPFMGTDSAFRLKASDRWLHELFYPNLQLKNDRRDELKLYAEGHGRIAGAIYPVTFMALALVGVLGGAFSRLGYGRRIAQVAVAAIVVRIIGFGVQPLVEEAAILNVLQYLVPIAPIVWAFRTLFRQKVGRRVPLSCDQEPILPGAGAAA
ncbi:MAG TPA: LptF/LptG family permease [Caulobacteraceae bacterium]|nr:LptF/LptG family permease [Caulobacteraceae bacterium]